MSQTLDAARLKWSINDEGIGRIVMRYRICAIIACIFVFGSAASPQLESASSTALPMTRATIVTKSGVASLKAHEARPLRQAIDAVASEYGWILDYEDPVYKAADLVDDDDTDQEWRAQHPHERGVTRPNGGVFATSFQTPTKGADATLTVSQIIESYAKSSNPGSFRVVDEGAGRIDIIGAGTDDGIFGTRVSLEDRPRTLNETLTQLFSEVSTVRGTKVLLGFGPANLLIRTVTVGGENISARRILSAALDSSGVVLEWQALYDADSNLYLVNIQPAVRAYVDSSGSRRLQVIKPQ